MDEIWKEINDCPNYYVSNAGEVARFIRGRLRKLKPHISVHGYIRYDISIEGHRRPKHISAHRLVAEAFIPNPDNLPYVNHKNEVKTDNRVENLEWCTAKYNATYGTKIRRMLTSRHKNNAHNREKPTIIVWPCGMITICPSIALAKKISNISDIWRVMNSTHKYKGFLVYPLTKDALGKAYEAAYLKQQQEEHDGK